MGTAWLARRARFHEDLRKDNDPLVYAQEYLAEFVDWSGVAFFSREKLLVDNQPLSLPTRCDAVFAVIDTASKTGTDNDATAVTFFAVDHIGRTPLLILAPCFGQRTSSRRAYDLLRTGREHAEETVLCVPCPSGNK